MSPFDSESCLCQLLTLADPALRERALTPDLSSLRQSVRALPPTAARVVLLNLVRGLPLVRGFASGTRPTAGRHGGHPWGGLVQALHEARSVLLGELGAGLAEPIRARLADLLHDGERLGHLHAACLANERGDSQAVRRFVGLAMQATPQGRHSDAWRHGRSAEQWYRFFSAWLAQGARPTRYAHASWAVRLPAWFDAWRTSLRNAQQPLWLVSRYLLWHDCGKPWVLERDAHGAMHYPEHARASMLTWRAFAQPEAQDVVAELIEHDMCAHRWTAADLDWLRTSPLGPTLLVAALAELHCNAALFGGIESESFRIKASRLERRGRQLCEHWFGAQA